MCVCARACVYVCVVVVGGGGGVVVALCCTWCYR